MSISIISDKQKEINFSNSRFKSIFELLGFESIEPYGDIDQIELIELTIKAKEILKTLENNKISCEFSIPETRENNYISPSIDKEYFQRKIKELINLFEESQTISWG